MTRRISFWFFICILVCCARANAAGADSVNSAVPPVEVLTDDNGDFVLDTPFPQWEKVTADDVGIGDLTSCVDPEGKIPDWAEPLPVEPVKCVALSGDGNELWAATGAGLIFLDLAGRRRLYFAGKRWLPDDDVISVGVTPEGDAYAKTLSGDSLLARRSMTLEQKALHFEKIMRERHNRMGMYTDVALEVPGDLSSYRQIDDDNDGQWTEMYLAAESFRYAVTKDPDALKTAREAFRAMERLLTVSPVKGYPSRSILPADRCPGADPERWRMLPAGDWCWKSDTSVDELVGHYFGLPIYYDLVADEEERKTIRRLIADMTDYIVGNGMRLLDEKGNVTTHGNWDPEWVNTVGRTGDQGLNSLQALNALRSAHHITGDEKYLNEYRRLIREHGYHKNVLREKEISDRFQVNHDSDEMAFLSFYNLLRYEDDPELRERFFMEGIRRAWEADLPERNPEQIVIYGAFAGRDFRLDLAVRTLREIPLDLIKWTVRNSHRADVKANSEKDRFGELQSGFVPPYTEVHTMRWSENMYLLDAEDGGRSEAMATFWLLPYWMARRHGMIRPAAGEGPE
ncbi:MAG: hypothetical protein ABIH66_12665 [bacterium]